MRVMCDTNFLLDFFNVGSSDRDCDAAKDVVSLCIMNAVDLMITPSTLKDFRYIFASRRKRAAQIANGEISKRDAAAVKAIVEAATNTVFELFTVAATGQVDCDMARVLMKTHDDFEDNIIAAVALRTDANCIITRNKAFAKHCPVTCRDPEAMMLMLNAGAR